MKYIQYLFLFLALAVVSSCSSDDDGPIEAQGCSPTVITDPGNQIAWIGQMIDDNQDLTENAQILCYQYNGGLVFLVDLCVTCGNGFTVYDCDQVEVCSNDQNGNDSCASIINNFTNEIVIWRNF